MKGPGHGRQYDVRRLWECPVCQKRVRTLGSIVNLRCEACARNKTGDTAWMRLLEPQRHARPSYPAAVFLPRTGKQNETLEPERIVPTPPNPTEL